MTKILQNLMRTNFASAGKKSFKIHHMTATDHGLACDYISQVVKLKIHVWQQPCVKLLPGDPKLGL